MILELIEAATSHGTCPTGCLNSNKHAHELNIYFHAITHSETIISNMLLLSLYKDRHASPPVQVFVLSFLNRDL